MSEDRSCAAEVDDDVWIDITTLDDDRRVLINPITGERRRERMADPDELAELPAEARS